MKAKDLKILRKKLTNANKAGNNPLDGMAKDALTLSVTQTIGDESAAKVLSLRFVSSERIPDPKLRECLDLFETNMGDMYRKSSWGLSMEEKAKEFQHANARYLLLTDPDDYLAGFVHFRFDYDDDERPTQPVLYVYEIQIDFRYRRLGLGKRLMDLTETIASLNGMEKVMLTVFTVNEAAMDFYKQLDYSIDESSPSRNNETADYEILSRPVAAKQ